MRIHKYVCDACQKAREAKTVPEGWLEYNIMSGQRFAVSFDDLLHACSEKCAFKGVSTAIKPFFQLCRSRGR